MDFYSNGGIVNGTFTSGVSAFDPNALEPLLLTNGPGLNVLRLRNQSTSGYSALSFSNNASPPSELAATGVGGSAGEVIFRDRSYFETISPLTNSYSEPTTFVLAADGWSGRSSTGFRFHQRMTVDGQGTQFWKGVPIVTDLTTQVEAAGFHVGGFFYMANTAVPSLADVPTSKVALYWDHTATAPKLKAIGRDSAGTPYGGDVSGSLTAVTAIASDDFTVADGATALNARAATVGTWVAPSNWGVSSNKAYRSGGTGADYAYIDVGAADGTVEASITLSGVRAVPGLITRRADSSNYVYCQIEKDGGGNSNKVFLFDVVSGSTQELGQVAYSLTLGSTYTVRLNAVGTEIALWINDVMVLRRESARSTGNGRGIWSYKDGSTDDGGSRWDNFRAYA